MTVQIALSRGMVALVDDDDGDLAETKWYAAVHSMDLAYAVHEGTLMHRVIAERVLGRPLSEKEQVDHINRDGLDNRRGNLRAVSSAENMRNRRSVPGVPIIRLSVATGRIVGLALPDSVTFVGPSKALSTKDLPDNLFRYLCLVWRLCWNSEAQRADWLGPTSMISLADLLHLHRATMWRALSQLRNLGWVEVIYLGSRLFRLRPRIHERENATPITMFPLESFQVRDIERELSTEATNAPPRDLVQNEEELSTGTTEAEALEILLKGVGVGQPARSRIIATGISIEKATQHLARKRIAKEPLAYAIKRMLDGLPVPDFCRVCFGIDGQHRWVQDETGPMECPVPRTKHWSAVEIADAFGENFGEITPLR